MHSKVRADRYVTAEFTLPPEWINNHFVVSLGTKNNGIPANCFWGKLETSHTLILSLHSNCGYVFFDKDE